MNVNSMIVLVCGAFIISVVGVAVSLSILNNDDFSLTTGHALVQTGNISIGIDTVLSITADDTIINFNGCRAGTTVYSNVNRGDGVDACESFSTDSIIIRNDGTLFANVSVSFSDWGGASNGTFLDSPDNSSWVVYAISNTSALPMYGGGCHDFMQSSWTNITDNSSYRACDRLAPDNSYNSFTFDIGINIPENMTSGSSSVSITFIASPV